MPNLVPGYDFQQRDDDPTDTNPNFSHGTQVASVVGAAGNNATGVAGVLWQVRVMPVRAFDAAGFGTSFAIANAIRYAAGLPNSSGGEPAEAARVINLSFAANEPTASEEAACVDARNAGAILVAAAGNQGRTQSYYPGAYPSVLAVAATDRAGGVTDYSNAGPWIDLAAPGGTFGDGVRTCGVDRNGQFIYVAVNGTSFAAPHVAGVAALLLCLRDEAPETIEQLLRETARDIGAPGRDDRAGFGLLDAGAAVTALLERPVPVLFRLEEVYVRLRHWPAGAPALEAATSEITTFDFSFLDVAPGEYVLEAGTDRNFDGVLDGPGEVYGRWSDENGEVLTVVPGARTDLDFVIAPK